MKKSLPRNVFKPSRKETAMKIFLFLSKTTRSIKHSLPGTVGSPLAGEYSPRRDLHLMGVLKEGHSSHSCAVMIYIGNCDRQGQLGEEVGARSGDAVLMRSR